MTSVLLDLATTLADGRVHVVDLTQPLGPDTPVIGLPPIFAPSPGVTIDVTREVDGNPDFLLTPERIAEWEAEFGLIPPESWVLLRTGWSRRTTTAAFLNVGADGPHSPGFDKRASELLAYDRDVLGVGVETIGTDAGQAARFDPPFPNHAIMHGAGKFGLASLCSPARTCRRRA